MPAWSWLSRSPLQGELPKAEGVTLPDRQRGIVQKQEISLGPVTEQARIRLQLTGNRVVDYDKSRQLAPTLQLETGRDNHR